MSRPAIAAGAALALLCATLFAVAAWRTLDRGKRAAGPLRAFAVFWLGGAGYAGADALWSFAYLAGVDALPVGIVVLQVKIASACASFAALASYLFGVFTGKSRANFPLAAGYLGLFLAIESYYAWRGPYAVHAGFSGLGLDYARDAPFVWDALLVLLFVPPIVATIAYVSLLRFAPSSRVRRRILLTTGSLALFFGPDLVGYLTGHWEWWDLAERALGLVAGLGMLFATSPRMAQRDVDDLRSASRAS